MRNEIRALEYQLAFQRQEMSRKDEKIDEGNLKLQQQYQKVSDNVEKIVFLLFDDYAHFIRNRIYSISYDSNVSRSVTYQTD